MLPKGVTVTEHIGLYIHLSMCCVTDNCQISTHDTRPTVQC